MIFSKFTFRHLLMCVMFLVTAQLIHAQKKELTDTQLLKNKLPEIIKPLPTFQWGEGDQLIITRRNDQTQSADRYVFDIKTKKEVPLKDIPKTKERKSVYLKGNDLFIKDDNGEAQLTRDEAKEINPTLSPDEMKVAYTKNNNLYVYDLVNKKETQFTTDGSETILNGYASWVYTEEILGRGSRYRAFWWSPDSKNIAFFRTDDSEVPVFTMVNARGQHGELEKIRYPKAGDKNPEVKIGIAHINNSAVTWADFNQKDDQYFGMPTWKKDGSLLQPWLNRDQNDLKIYAVNPENGNKSIFYEEQQKTWVDLDDNDRLTILGSGKAMILSDKTGWRHIYLHDAEGKLINAVTEGKYTVTNVIQVDEKNQVIYFTARGKENTARSDFYRVGFNGKNLKRLTSGDFNNRVQLSPSGKYFINTYSNTSSPARIALVDYNGNKIADLADAKGKEFDNYEIAKTELIRVKSDDGLYELPAMVTWPTHMEPGKKYPVLIAIYGGPNAGTVMDGFSFNPNREWYAREGLIQIAMDHRASGHFGKEGVNYMYHNLGYWEMKDYSTIVKYLIANKQADPAKIGITGFSYGGYLSAYAVTYGADVFTHGMAGGSVTDWTLYDSHYTEKFMGTPKNNPEGYKSASVFTWVGKYKDGLQLVHGEIDDNVHMQNSLQLAGKLQDLKKPFEFMIYPGGRHGWGGEKGLHFANLKTAFIYRNLLGKELPKELIR